MKKILKVMFFLLIGSSLFAQTVEEDVSVKEISTRTAQVAISNPDYMVTSGDIYNLAFVAGTTPVSYSILVDSSYKIKVANLATLDATGKSYITLKRQVEEIVSKNYPMSAVQFVLTQPSSFTVVVKGEVKSTQEVNVWALSRLSSVIKGCETAYSSTRDITVISTTGKKKSYDLFKATRFGDLSQDPYLRPGDIIEIKRADRKVSIGGAVERPGTYELLKGENLKTLVSYYANGLTVQADTTRMELSRRVGTEFKTGQKIYLDKNVMDEDFELVYYDYVTIPSYESLKPVVFVEGAVNVSAGDSGTQQDASNRIPYRFEVGTNYAQFVRSHIGLFSAVSDTENAYVIRKGEIIPLNVSEMLYNANFYSDFELEENDILRIPFKQLFVVVSGAVNQPGKYPYIPDRTYDYYVNLAGGFIKEKNRGDAVKIIDINGEKVTKSEYITPESIIDAKSNSFLYFFNQYAPILTTLLSVVGTTLSVLAVTQAK